MSLAAGAFAGEAFSISYTDSNTGETLELSFASFAGVEFMADVSDEQLNQKTQNEMKLGSTPSQADLQSHLTQAIPDQEFTVAGLTRSGTRNSALVEVPNTTTKPASENLSNNIAFNLAATGMEVFELKVKNSAGEELVFREYTFGGVGVGVS